MSPAGPGPVRDPGLQPERTSLAWQRTALALAVVGLAAPRVGWPVLGAWVLLPSGLVVAGAVIALLASRPRYLRLLAADGATGSLDGRLPLLMTVLALALAILAAALVIVPVVTAP